MLGTCSVSQQQVEAAFGLRRCGQDAAPKAWYIYRSVGSCGVGIRMQNGRIATRAVGGLSDVQEGGKKGRFLPILSFEDVCLQHLHPETLPWKIAIQHCWVLWGHLF